MAVQVVAYEGCESFWGESPFLGDSSGRRAGSEPLNPVDGTLRANITFPADGLTGFDGDSSTHSRGEDRVSVRA